MMSVVGDRQKATVKMSNCESILKYTRYALLIAGTFDIRNETTNSSFLYKSWSLLSQGYYTLFVLSLLVGMKDVLRSGVDDATFNINMQTFLFSSLLLMKLVLFYTRRIRDIIKEVYEFENDITHDDLECTQIYNRNSRYNYKIFFILCVMTLSTGFLYMFNAFNDWMLMNVGNSMENKTLIYRGWFPFDVGNPIYFNVAYFFQFPVGIWLPGFIIVFDSLFISMVNFATARIDILGFKFENFEMYSDGRNESKFHCLRNIVMEHQDLIRYVENVNESLKWYFLGEVLVKSYQITVSLVNVIHATNKGDLLFYLFIVIGLLLHLIMVYYNANELSLESTNLCVKIFKSNWYDQYSEVVRSLSIVMARVQRPLELTIGNFRVIDNDLIVNIFKAGYTFLVYQKI
ncbi:unnamed protein product [Phaedon cochleariae]|uniref:Odorant receptor n=1 Tax=Phaedon cochleariae TaxID=80249 RepID=A0A9P0DHY8_PHACE|nr:unnamed protein product [Phaedon cochleariae]